jgi:hypothetical protein
LLLPKNAEEFSALVGKAAARRRVRYWTDCPAAGD